MSLTETVPTVPPSVFTCLSFHDTPEERSQRKVKSSRRSSSRWCDVPPTIDEEDVEVGGTYLAALQGNGLNTRSATLGRVTESSTSAGAGGVSMREGQQCGRVPRPGAVCKTGEVGNIPVPGDHPRWWCIGSVCSPAAQQVRCQPMLSSTLPTSKYPL